MKNRVSSKSILFLFSISIGIFSFLGCASEYILLEPTKIEFHHKLQQVDCTDIKITYKYNILRDRGNHLLAKNEKSKRISLLAVLIVNPSEDTLYFPEDITIISNDDEIIPMTKKEAVGALVAKYSSNEEVDFEIETKSGTWYLGTGLLNDYKTIISNKSFSDEMKEYYLMNSIVLPETTVSGLLALPIQSNSPLTFHLRE